jgi:hypothetical protein
MPRRLINAVSFAVALLLVSHSNVAQAKSAENNHDFANEYQQLQKLQFKILSHGASDEDSHKLRAIRDYFVQTGDSGARFLIGKLNAMSEDERKYLKGSEQYDIRMVQYVQRLIDRGQAITIKYSIGFILADMFGRTSPDTQTAILKAMFNSYTPSTYGKEDRQNLDAAFIRIGRPAIPYLIEVANHNFPSVRCGAVLSLTDLAQEAKKAGLPDAPPLDCNAPPEQRQLALREWKAWWEKYGDKFPFPEIPSFFDLPHQSPDHK